MASHTCNVGFISPAPDLVGVSPEEPQVADAYPKCLLNFRGYGHCIQGAARMWSFGGCVCGHLGKGAKVLREPGDVSTD